MRSVFKYNYINEKTTKIYELKNPLAAEPWFGCLNNDQTKLIVSSDSDALYVDM